MIETTGNWALKSITFASAVAYFDSGTLTANKDMVRRRHKIVHVDKRNFRLWFKSSCGSLKLLSSLFSSVDGFFCLFGWFKLRA